MILNRFRTMMNRIGATCGIEEIFKILTDCYNEPHRAYHTMTHIRECLKLFDTVSKIAKNPDHIEAAIWFHDAVYDPKSHDNEEKSSELAYHSLTACGVSENIADNITNLVLSTSHNKMLSSEDEKLIADIDLSILGNNQQKFDEYETQIRQEYHFVSDDVYRKGRSEILRSFIEREKIYQTDIFHVQYEYPARENIRRLQNRLNNQIN